MKKKKPSTPHALPILLGVPFLFIQFRTLAFLFFSNFFFFFLAPLNIQVYFPDFISSPLAVHQSVLRPTGNIHLTPAPDVFVIKQLQTTGVPAAFLYFFRRPSWLGWDSLAASICPRLEETARPPARTLPCTNVGERERTHTHPHAR